MFKEPYTINLGPIEEFQEKYNKCMQIIHRLMKNCSFIISYALLHLLGMEKCNHISHTGSGKDSWDNKIDIRRKEEVGRGKLVGSQVYECPTKCLK